HPAATPLPYTTLFRSEAHDTAAQVLREHLDDLHRISTILIERETIDKEQFERLLAGQSETSVFPDEVPEAAPEPAPADDKSRKPDRKSTRLNSSHEWI